MDDAKCLSQSFQYFDHKLDDSKLQVLDLKIFFRLQALRLHTQHIAFVAFESFHPWCKTSGFQWHVLKIVDRSLQDLWLGSQ